MTTTTNPTTLTADALAAGTVLATALAAAQEGDHLLRQAVADALPDVADRYVRFATAVRKAVVALGQPMAADADGSTRGAAIRSARDSIAADAVGAAAALREILDSLTGVGAKNGSTYSRAANIASAIGKADGSGAKVTDVRRFISLHIDRDDVVIGIAKLATWCTAGAADALPDTSGARGGGKADADAGTDGAGAGTAGAGAGGKAGGKAVSTEPMTLAQAVEAMHRGIADSALEAAIAAAPVDVAALPDDAADALLAALLAVREMHRRSDAGIVVADDAVSALSALATADK